MSQKRKKNNLRKHVFLCLFSILFFKLKKVQILPKIIPGVPGALVIKKKNILLLAPIRLLIIYVLIILKTSPFNNWNNERFE